MSLLLDLMRNTALPLTIRKKFAKWHDIPAEGSFKVPFYSQTYLGQFGIHMDDKIYRYGAHESATIRLMRDLLAKQKEAHPDQEVVYLDIGTNSGMHLLAVADMIDKGYGFEPWDGVRGRADENIRTNKLEHISVFPFGLSDVDASVAFLPPSDNNLGVGSIANDDITGTIQIDVRRGDDVVKEEALSPCLMKIDVEGHEESVLRGLAETIKRCQPDIIFEYNDGAREDLKSEAKRKSLFGSEYKFYGILRSREFPKLEVFHPERKYENVLASTKTLVE